MDPSRRPSSNTFGDGGSRIVAREVTRQDHCATIPTLADLNLVHESRCSELSIIRREFGLCKGV